MHTNNTEVTPEFDPYLKWLGIPPEEQPPNHYRILAIPLFTGDPDVIENAADQRMAHLRNIQTGQRASLAQQMLNHVASAKVCLLTPSQKSVYDDKLRASMIERHTPPMVVEVESPNSVPPVSQGPNITVTKYLKQKRATKNQIGVAVTILAICLSVFFVIYFASGTTNRNPSQSKRTESAKEKPKAERMPPIVPENLGTTKLKIEESAKVRPSIPTPLESPRDKAPQPATHPAVGTWRTPAGKRINIKDNGEVTVNTISGGTWTILDSRSIRLTMNSGSIDTVRVTGSGQTADSTFRRADGTTGGGVWKRENDN